MLVISYCKMVASRLSSSCQTTLHNVHLAIKQARLSMSLLLPCECPGIIQTSKHHATVNAIKPGNATSPAINQSILGGLFEGF